MAESSDTVLVSGGSGYLAGWCIAEALNAGHSVRATLRTPSREAEVRNSLASLTDHADRLSFHVADLTSDDGWADAAAGCRYVLHVASPFPTQQPKDADELIIPAREGTLRVLRAGLDAGAERIVVTSSIAAAGRNAGTPSDRKLDEDDWTDPTSAAVSPYAKSKTIAEHAAWDLVEKRGVREKLAVVNPGAILGPVTSDDDSFSLQMVTRLLGGVPAVPRIGFNLVDVRDIAQLELAAMTAAEAAGKRFVGVARFTWMQEVAEILRENLGHAAHKVPKRQAPDFLIKLMGRFDPSVRSIVPDLGAKHEFSHERASTLLGWQPRPVEQTVVDCGRSIAARGSA